MPEGGGGGGESNEYIQLCTEIFKIVSHNECIQCTYFE